MKSVLDFAKRKDSKQKISMITCYDSTFAGILKNTDIDCILVGDSAAMVMHGYENTLAATPEMLEPHIAAVRRGCSEKFLIADIPFLLPNLGRKSAFGAIRKFMASGAQAVKVEGPVSEFMEELIHSGVPVMGHLGLTPQFINQFGGFRVQGRTEAARKQLLNDAQKLTALGVFALVLEGIPASLAREISEALDIPTIGIGAGVGCDGQVLVIQDLLGLNPDFQPRFVRRYLSGADLVKEAVNSFCRDVKEETFPNEKESY